MTPLIILWFALIVAGAGVLALRFILKALKVGRLVSISLQLAGGVLMFGMTAYLLACSESEFSPEEGYEEAFGRPKPSGLQVQRAFGTQAFDWFGVYLVMKANEAAVQTIVLEQKLRPARSPGETNHDWSTSPDWWTNRPPCRDVRHYVPDKGPHDDWFAWLDASATSYSHMLIAQCPSSGLVYAVTYSV